MNRRARPYYLLWPNGDYSTLVAHYRRMKKLSEMFIFLMAHVEAIHVEAIHFSLSLHNIPWS